MKLRGDDTIGAISTAMGEGAISVVRVSGPLAFSLIDPIFQGKRTLSDAAGYTIHLGHLITQSGKVIDEVLVSVFRSPHSYTGEDLLEISCHGGTVMSQQVLESVLSRGVRQADPGEFTKRAFLNGKLDLAQAEAVANIISAKSKRSISTSMDQLRGKLSDCVESIKQELLDICALLELELDFSDEGVEISSKDAISERLNNVITRIESLIQSFDQGRIHREGVTVAIIGKPNVGKSSIFNALLNSDRSIVTHIAGTTRDTIEESIQIDGVLFRLIDTAGIRTSEDPVEVEGIKRTHDYIESSDIIVTVIDCTDIPGSITTKDPHSQQKSLTVLNKIDLLSSHEHDRQILDDKVAVSSKTGAGIPTLKKSLSRLVSSDRIATSDVEISSLRHYEALSSSVNSLKAALSSIDSQRSTELAAADIRSAMNSLSEITGEITTDDILNRVFGSFCIGK
ncbi:MAG: tRNA uridine-5-carboxymethylaminomethyl(34) synthesis GTPase MnmE [Bacteroidota bacterium]